MAAITPEREKWRNKKYPNLQSDVIIPSAPIGFDTSIADHGYYSTGPKTSTPSIRVVDTPKYPTSAGRDGNISYDSSYFYIKVQKEWKRIAISEFIRTCDDTIPISGQEGKIAYNSQSFYIYTAGVWRKNTLSGSSLDIAGTDGSISYDSNYFYIYTEGSWKQMPLESMYLQPQCDVI